MRSATKSILLVALLGACTTAPEPIAPEPEAVAHELPPCATFPGPGDHVYKFKSGGVERRLILHAPASYAGQPLPLVFVLHGAGGTAKGMVGSTKMSCLADTKGFFVAYLDGTRCVPTAQNAAHCSGVEQMWNNGLTPDAGIVVDDVQFTRDTIAYISALWQINQDRIYVTGLSNGGMMTHRLASEMSSTFAGAAAVAGLIARDPEGDGTYLHIPDARGPIPMMIMHGTADAAIGYDGTTGHLCPCKSVDEAVAHWVAQNECVGPAVTTVSGIVTTTEHRGCLSTTHVTLVSIEGGPHAWPPFASDMIWRFFDKHR